MYTAICKPSILLLSETRVTEDIYDSELDIKDYVMVRCNSKNRHTGGVLVYVNKKINFTTTEIVINEGNYWYVVININLGHKTIYLCTFYHSPNSSHSIFLDALEDLCDRYKNKNCVLVGDVNINYLTNNYYADKCKNLIQIYGYKQLITEPTRVSLNSNTLIDYVISNVEFIHPLVYDTPKISDHSIINIQIKKSECQKINTSVCAKKIFSRKITAEKLEDINAMLIKENNWMLHCTDMEIFYSNMNNIIEKHINEIMPIVEIEINNNRLPWYDSEVKTRVHERDLSYKMFKNASLNDKEGLWNEYKIKRNKVVNLLKKKKTNYYENKIDIAKDDPKRMWKTIKELINPNKDDSICTEIITFENNGKMVKILDVKDKAENFNNYYIQSINEVITSIMPGLCIPRTQMSKNCSMIEFKTLEMHELSKIIKTLNNKTSCLEVINKNVLKNAFECIGHVLLNFINLSISTGQIPNVLKISTITPIPKIKNTKLASNFRPINSLPCIEKVLEKVVYTQIKKYIEDNKILMTNQSGFRVNHSCETAIQFTVTKLKEILDDDKYIVAVFLDLKRAFETVDRSLLLQKLSLYGIDGNVLLWFKSYLENRGQRVKIGSVFSDVKNINVGVPQGSILGPLLYLLYINDIDLYHNCEFINLFADDTLLISSNYDLNMAIQLMNVELNNIANYLNINKLKLNINKTVGMVITSSAKLKNIKWNEINLHVQNEKIKFYDEYKYLGIIIDSTLSFNKYFENLYKKISKKLNFFCRISNLLTLKGKLNVYNATIQPHFDYCSTILFSINKIKIQELQKLQNRGMRILLNYNRYTPIKVMLTTLDWMSVDERIYFRTMVFIFKIVNNLFPSYLRQYVKFNREIHKYETRTNNSLYVKKGTSTRGWNTVMNKGFVLYNDLNNDIKNSSNVHIFKSKLKLLINNKL